MSKNQKENGFTIIEVVLVLAIAGLIFLMVFIALPSLQRGWRDTQRNNDLGRLVSATTNYSHTNRGNIPTTQQGWNSLVDQYLTIDGDTFVDPSGTQPSQTSDTYVMSSEPDTSSTITADFTEARNIIYYTNSAVCHETEGASVSPGGSRRVAFRIVLEGGGVACRNN